MLFRSQGRRHKANEEVIRLVAAALGVAKGDVVLARGATARHKLLKVLQ